jgi:hypothetical protein
LKAEELFPALKTIDKDKALLLFEIFFGRKDFIMCETQNLQKYRRKRRNRFFLGIEKRISFESISTIENEER